ncbi:RseA family anti-sigma factor [Halochromatium roseum]|uniref:RseA family anti-sigma factor n=1 Tax=Halochromatium roseum TaxID=391920 RepID=UPI001913BF97|nr:RseA family anti-sigma factor [Halochromatium roseum]
MTTPTSDQRYLAAMIDGEPGPGGGFEAAIDAVERDAALRARFERGILIGQLLRAEPAMPAARAVSARVAAALASEPVVMRPSKRQASRRSSSINRSAVGLAIAASLVAVAIMIGPGLMTGSGFGPSLESSPIAQSDPAAVQEYAALTEPMVERWALDEPVSSTALDALLVDHRERASASGLTGFIPYAAVVGPSGVR